MSSNDEFKALITAFGQKSEELEELSYQTTQIILDLRDNEELAHQETKTCTKKAFDAEYYRNKNAPVEVQDLPEEIDIENFQQKLNQLQDAKLAKKKRDEEVMRQINEKKEEIAEIEESMRKKLEVINAAKQFLA